MKHKTNNVIIIYLLNVILTILLLVLKLNKLINCSIFVCLLPVILVNVFFGVSIVVICYLLTKTEMVTETEKENKNGKNACKQ